MCNRCSDTAALVARKNHPYRTMALKHLGRLFRTIGRVGCRLVFGNRLTRSTLKLSRNLPRHASCAWEASLILMLESDPGGRSGIYGVVKNRWRDDCRGTRNASESSYRFQVFEQGLSVFPRGVTCAAILHEQQYLSMTTSHRLQQTGIVHFMGLRMVEWIVSAASPGHENGNRTRKFASQEIEHLAQDIMSGRGIDFLEHRLHKNVTDADRHGGRERAKEQVNECAAEAEALGIIATMPGPLDQRSQRE